VIFFHTPLYLTSPLGWGPSEYCHPVWYGKTRRWKNFEDKCHRLDRIPACDCDERTDGQTDGQTDILPQNSPRYAYTSRHKTRSNVRPYVRAVSTFSKPWLWDRCMGRRRWNLAQIFYECGEKTSSKRNFEFLPLRRERDVISLLPRSFTKGNLTWLKCSVKTICSRTLLSSVMYADTWTFLHRLI